MILNCGCTSGPNGVKLGVTDQDARYGVGNRVHTPTSKEGTFRCTVCLHERGMPGKAETAKGSPKKSGEKLAKVKS